PRQRDRRQANRQTEQRRTDETRTRIRDWVARREDEQGEQPDPPGRREDRQIPEAVARFHAGESSGGRPELRGRARRADVAGGAKTARQGLRAARGVPRGG